MTTEQTEYLPALIVEMTAACRTLRGYFRLGFDFASAGDGPDTQGLWLTVGTFANWSEPAEWAVDAENWRGVVRQAKRQLGIWLETGKADPTPGCGVQGKF